VKNVLNLVKVGMLALNMSSYAMAMDERLLIADDDIDAHHVLEDINHLFSAERRASLGSYYSPAEISEAIVMLAGKEDPAYTALICHHVSRGQEEHKDEAAQARREQLEHACMASCLSELVKKDRERAQRKRRLIGRYRWANCCCKFIIIMQIAVAVTMVSWIPTRMGHRWCL
jgi:hypothetical protein